MASATANNTTIKVNQALKENLLGLADNYFVSVFDVFRKTVKRNKRETLYFFVGFGLVLLSAATFIFGLIKFFNVSKDSGESSLFLVVAAGLGYVFVLVFVLTSLYDRKNKKLLPSTKLAFCHLYNCIRELRAYLTNERREHIRNARFDFAQYLINSEVNFTLEVEEFRPTGMGGAARVTVRKPANIARIVQDVSEKFWWFSIADTTKTIISAYDQLPSKISPRLHQGEEIDKVLACLNDLVLYEYSKLRKTSVEEFTPEAAYSISEAGRACLFDFSEAIGQIEPLTDTAKQKEGYFRTKLKRASSQVASLLVSQNILVSFISWYLLFSFVFGLSILITLKVTRVALDSTLLIGLFAVPFTAAVAVSTAIFTKTRH